MCLYSPLAVEPGSVAEVGLGERGDLDAPVGEARLHHHVAADQLHALGLARHHACAVRNTSSVHTVYEYMYFKHTCMHTALCTWCLLSTSTSGDTCDRVA